MIRRIVGELFDKQVNLLIDLEQYRSLGCDPEYMEELRHMVEASTELVEQIQRESVESGRELLTSIKMKED